MTDLLTTGDIAREAGVMRETVVAWIKRGHLKPWHRTQRGTRLFRRGDVEQYLAARAAKAGQR